MTTRQPLLKKEAPMQNIPVAFILALSIIALFEPIAPAEDAMLTFSACATVKNGKLYNQRLGNTPLKPCRKGEMTVNWSQSVPPAVYDANGQKVGDIIGTLGLAADYGISRPIVLTKMNGYAFSLIVRSNGLLGSLRGGSGPFFESADCSGEAFVRVGENVTAIMPLARVIPEQSLGNVYLVDFTAVPHEVSYASRLDDDTGQCVVAAGSDHLTPAIFIGDLSTEFTPPFSVR